MLAWQPSRVHLKDLTNTTLFTAVAAKTAAFKLAGIGTAAAAIGLGVGVTVGGGKLWDESTKKKKKKKNDNKMDFPKQPKEPKEPKQLKQPKQPSQPKPLKQPKQLKSAALNSQTLRGVLATAGLSLKDRIMATPTSNNFAKHIGLN